MTKPASTQQHIRILDAQGVSWREIARRLGVSGIPSGNTRPWRTARRGPWSGRGRRSLIDVHSDAVDSWLAADGLMPRKQRHARQTSVRQARGGEGGSGLVFVRAALREEGARRASSGQRQVPRAQLARRDHAGRFQRGRRHDRRWRRQGPLPGRHVPAFEHGARGRDAGRERGMRVREAGPDLRPHRHGSPHAGARTPRARATSSRGTRSPWCACSPCPATTTGSRRGSATRIRQREGIRRERGPGHGRHRGGIGRRGSGRWVRPSRRMSDPVGAGPSGGAVRSRQV